MFWLVVGSFKRALTPSFEGEIMSERDLCRDIHNIYEISRANVAWNILKINFIVLGALLSEMRSPSWRRHQCGSSVNKPTSQFCVGWLLACTLHYLQFIPPCLWFCVCCLCLLSVWRLLTHAFACAAMSQLCVAMWPAIPCNLNCSCLAQCFVKPRLRLGPLKTSQNK